MQRNEGAIVVRFGLTEAGRAVVEPAPHRHYCPTCGDYGLSCPYEGCETRNARGRGKVGIDSTCEDCLARVQS